jgi:hypothetical protein
MLGPELPGSVPHLSSMALRYADTRPHPLETVYLGLLSPLLSSLLTILRLRRAVSDKQSLLSSRQILPTILCSLRLVAKTIYYEVLVVSYWVQEQTLHVASLWLIYRKLHVEC